MSEEQDNVQLLIDAGALDPNDITEEHRKVLNEEFSPEEMTTIIKMSEKIKGKAFGSSAAF